MVKKILTSKILALSAFMVAGILFCTAGCTSVPGGNVTAPQTPAATTSAYQDAEFKANVQNSLPLLTGLIGVVNTDLAAHNLTSLATDSVVLTGEAVRLDNKTAPMVVSPAMSTVKTDYQKALGKIEDAGASAERAVIEQGYSAEYGTNPLVATYLQQTGDYLSEGRQLLEKVASEIGT
jgi:hypothetical protein